MRLVKYLPVQSVSDSVYVELFRVTCTGQIPTAIIAILFAQVAIILSFEIDDAAIHIVAIAGILLSLARILLMSLHLKRLRVEVDNLAAVKRAERIYIAGSLLFAGLLGLLGARTFSVSPQLLRHESVPLQSLQLLVTALLLGYAAGLVTRGFALFWNGTLSLCLASVPLIVACAFNNDGIYRALAVLLLVFLAAGIESSAYLYASYVQRITLEQKFTTLARNDELTGLFNRLALREGFEILVKERAAGTLLAVHCLDLDGFKAVNDRYGHPVGDDLLRLVSRRLANVLRNGDFAARLGGDEFIVVQTGISEAWQAERLAQRLIEAVTAPYFIETDQISIGTSIGIALGCRELKDSELDLDELIARADAALYQVKRQNSGSYLMGGDGCE